MSFLKWPIKPGQVGFKCFLNGLLAMKTNGSKQAGWTFHQPDGSIQILPSFNYPGLDFFNLGISHIKGRLYPLRLLRAKS